MTAIPLFLQTQDVENTGEAAQEAREAVKTVDTAGVVEPQSGHERRQEKEAQGGDQTCCEAQEDSKVGLQQDI